MVASVETYGGFYMGRYEASYGSGNDLSDYTPASKRVESADSGRIWVRFSPQDATIACQNLYADNEPFRDSSRGESTMIPHCNG